MCVIGITGSAKADRHVLFPGFVSRVSLCSFRRVGNEKGRRDRDGPYLTIAAKAYFFAALRLAGVLVLAARDLADFFVFLAM